MPRSLSAQGPSPKPNPNLAVVPDTGYLIPPHVMGRNIDDPTEDLVASGRRLQKPRLGVRVPYRNLTSQIVTQDEIAQEILQRSLRRNPLPAPPEVKDVFFAMKLTQRLAHRLTSPASSPVKTEGVCPPMEGEETVIETSTTVETDPLGQAEQDEEVDKKVPLSKFTQKLDPLVERELALKQLNELPSMKTRRRNRKSTKEPKVEGGIEGQTSPPKRKSIPKVTQEAKQNQQNNNKNEVDQSIQTYESALTPQSEQKKVTKKRKSEQASPVVKKLKPEAKKSPLVNGDTSKKSQSPPKLTPIKGKQIKSEEESMPSPKVFPDIKTPPNEDFEKAPSEISEAGSAKKRRSKMRELDMLLGDEGAVNMIYEAEHGQKQSKSATSRVRQSRARTTVKSRQDLLLKARLVKNAVLRLSSAGAVNFPSRPRARRKTEASPPTSPPSLTPSEPRSPLQNFPFSPKMMLGAEQSRIIRRHSSSSSFSSRSGSPSPNRRSFDLDKAPNLPSERPLQIIPGPKKKGVPIFIKKVEKTYKGKKKLPVQSTSSTPNLDSKNNDDKRKELRLTPKINLKNVGKKLLIEKKSKISAAVKNKLKDEMSKNFQLGLEVTKQQQRVYVPSWKKRKELESKPYEASVVHAAAESTLISLEDDITLKTLEAQLAEMVGEEEPPRPVFVTPASPPTNQKQDANLFAPSTSSGGVMKPPASLAKKGEDMMRQRSSVRQSAGTFCYREINLRRYDNLVQIILTPGSTKMKNSLNVQVLRELRDALQQLRRDEGCRVVLLSSTGSSFCQGVDVHSLLHTNADRRKKAAQELASALKEFLRALATFNKPIAAAVHGPAVGLGVTMLPYFDMVFASDKATFYAPYSKLGQVPEGAVTLTLPSVLGNAMASELLYGCRKLTASEALRCGLVTRILWPDRFQEELIPTLCTIASQSSQGMEATKALLREGLRSKLDAALEAESTLLVNHWCSLECQKAFKKLLEAEGVGLQRQRVDPSSV